MIIQRRSSVGFSRVGRSVSAVVCLFVSTSCGAGDGSASCAPRLEFEGVHYKGTGLKGALPATSPAGEGKLRCTVDRDTAEVREIQGVPRDVALASESGRSVWLAAGVLVQPRSHPLHDQIFGSAGEPDEERRRICRRMRRLEGAMARPPVPFGPIAFKPRQGRSIQLVADARTRVRGFETPAPRFEEGTPVRIRVRVCRYGYLIARLIEPAAAS
jgi:hypothetical protein